MRLDKRAQRWLVIVLAISLSLFIGIKLGGIVLSGYRLYQDYKALRETVADGAQITTLVALDEPLHSAVAHYDLFYARTYGLAKLGRHLAWMPEVGTTLAQAPQLLDLGQVSLYTGLEVYDTLIPVFQGIPTDTSFLTLVPDLTSLLGEREVYLRTRLGEIDQILCTLDLELLHSRLRGPLTSVKTLLPLAQAGTELLERIPDLGGFGDGPDSQRVYLVLALNEDELRPGGGFISSVGEVAIRNANVISVDFSDSYRVDNYKEPYPLTPKPLESFMGLQLWVFRDSNWSPDFPTAVSQAMQVYYPKSGRRQIHGAFSVDQHAVSALVSAFGEINLPDQDEPVTGETVIDYMRSAYEPGQVETDTKWFAQRKNFVADIANVMMHRLMNGKVNWLDLGETVITMLNEHHIQAHSFYADVDEVLSDFGWNGSLRVPDGDYVMVAEANVSYNKSSQLIDRAMTYTIDLTGVQPVAKLKIDYTHTSTRDIACIPETWYSATYVEMMNKCTWLYLQTYVPRGAVLIDYSEHPLPAELVFTGKPWSGIPVVRETTEVVDTTVFEQALVLPTKSYDEVMFEYTLPTDTLLQVDGQYTYRLEIQKQAGIEAVPVKVLLRLPKNTVLLNGSSNWQRIEPGLWSIETTLTGDVQLEAIYSMDEG